MLIFFFSDLARKAILFHKPQLSVVTVAARLKLVPRHRVYTQSVCNFLSWGCVLVHVMLFKYSSSL